MEKQFEFTLADGCVITGAVQGCGGIVDSLAMLERSIARASIGKHLVAGVLEFEPGHIGLYLNPTSESLGEQIHVHLVGCTVREVQP